MPVWRQMMIGDLISVEAVAEIVHPAFPEAPEVFANRLALFPAGCFMAVEDGRALGYCIAHPGKLGEPPPLDTLMMALPEGADCLYLHDLALLPESRGRRLGAALVARLEQVARANGFAHIALTAVNHSDGFWESVGFQPMECQALDSYGEATYRVKELA